MRRSRFSEDQIFAVLKEPEAGMKTQEVCRKHGVNRRRRLPLHAPPLAGVVTLAAGRRRKANLPS